MERAADWVFSHMTELAAMEVDQPSEVGPTYHDGPGSKLSRVPVLCIPLDHLFVALLSSYTRICN